ncbi:cadherin-related family member 1-like [Haliotis rubra]|uniref:cadherin-related family member 1-like n=1 Tax=Haliotis rubra TaxID=36100 RepID=UPI001EE55083|nr:cadherin-related family member 1-like [Haliotis rubra]
MFICRGNDIVLNKPLNRDTEPMYNVVLRVSDEVNTVERSLLIVVTDVNDKKPEVRVSDAVIVERRLGGAILYGGTVSAIDADVNDTLTFQLIDSPSTAVVVDPQTGVVSLNHTATIIQKTFPQIFTIAVTDNANHVTTTRFSLSMVSSGNGVWSGETTASQSKAGVEDPHNTGGAFTIRMTAGNHTASNKQNEHHLQTPHRNIATLCHNLASAVVQTSAVYLLLLVLLFWYWI